MDFCNTKNTFSWIWEQGLDQQVQLKKEANAAEPAVEPRFNVAKHQSAEEPAKTETANKGNLNQ